MRFKSSIMSRHIRNGLQTSSPHDDTMTSSTQPHIKCQSHHEERRNVRHKTHHISKNEAESSFENRNQKENHFRVDPVRGPAGPRTSEAPPAGGRGRTLVNRRFIRLCNKGKFTVECFEQHDGRAKNNKPKDIQSEYIY